MPRSWGAWARRRVSEARHGAVFSELVFACGPAAMQPALPPAAPCPFPRPHPVRSLLARPRTCAQNCTMAGAMSRMSAVLTRKELIMVAPGRMGYSLITRKLRPSMKLPCEREVRKHRGKAFVTVYMRTRKAQRAAVGAPCRCTVQQLPASAPLSRPRPRRPTFIAAIMR